MKTMLLPILALVTGITLAAPAEDTPASHHGMRQHGETSVKLPFPDSAQAVLWQPDLTLQPLTITQGEIKLPKTSTDNYHAIVAEQQQGKSKSAWIRYVYRHGKPSGHSTSELTAANKTELEIVPAPVPREHQHYQSNERWSFLVRYQGTPLPQQPVALTTRNGSHLKQLTDSHGKVTFKLPDDFPHLVEGKRDKRQAELQLSTEYSDNGEQFHTRLAASYAVNPAHWQFTGWGLIAMACGLVTGGVFICRQQHNTGPHV